MPYTYQRKHHAVKSPPLSKEEDETIAKNTIVDLPLCIIEEIISRASVEDLLKWKCVSKPWHDLISSPEFARVHLNRSKDTSMAIMDYCGSCSHSTAERLAGNKVYYLPKILPRGKLEIVGSCDGLICLMNRGNRNTVILNPSTGDYWRLGAAKYCSDWSHSWFGHHPCTGDYTLFLGSNCFSYRFNFVTQIENWNINNDECYESSRDLVSVDRIKHLDPGKYTIFEEIGILLHETLHWPACIQWYDDNGYYQYQAVNKVVTYDFNKNEVSEIAVPCVVYRYMSRCFTLGVLDGCLFGVFKFQYEVEHNFELWVMKEYGVEESWTKYRNIPGYRYFDKLTPLGFCSDDEMIMDADRSGLIKCSLISDDKSELPKCSLISACYRSRFRYYSDEKTDTVANIHRCKDSKAIIFTESLVSFERSIREVEVSLSIRESTKKYSSMSSKKGNCYPQTSRRKFTKPIKEIVEEKIMKVLVGRLEEAEI